MLAACCLAMAPSRGGRPRGGARAAKSAPVWQVAEQEWDHKAVQPAAKATGGRSRAARRQGFYDGLRAYAEHWQPLLQAEWDGEQQLLREQLEQWPRARLAREGLLLSRLEAKVVDELFGDAVVQLGLPPSPAGGRAPLPYHRFAPGDMVALREGDAASLPASPRASPRSMGEGEEGEAVVAAGAGSEGSEGVVEGVLLQRTATALLVVLRELPPALAAGRGGSGGGGGGGGGGVRGGRGAGGLRPTSRATFSLTRHSSAVPFERCSAALQAAADPAISEGEICAELRDLVLSSWRDCDLPPSSSAAPSPPPPKAAKLKGAQVKGAKGAASEGGDSAAVALAAAAAQPPAFLSGKGVNAAALVKAAATAAAQSAPAADRLNPGQLTLTQPRPRRA